MAPRNSRTAHALGALSLLLSSLLLPTRTLAQSYCVYDPLGANGDYAGMAKDYQLAAKRWGVTIDIKPYTDEALLHDAFKTGQCDMASMIGMRAREFNLFSGTLDAPSVIENYSQERTAMAVVASPKAAPYLKSNGYEVVGIIPIGAAYVMTSDRSINSFDRAVGKKIPVMAWDPTQSMMVKDFKAIPVPVQLTQFADYFNTGKVDLIVAPLAIYKAMELYKGIGSKGGIVHRPLFVFTMQVISHADRFPPSFGQQSRDYMLAQTDHALSLAHNLEAQIDNRLWIYALRQEVVKWDNTMRNALEHMTNSGYFDPRMLGILQHIRCRSNPENHECDAGTAQ